MWFCWIFIFTTIFSTQSGNVLAVEARGYALHHCKVAANFCPKVSEVYSLDAEPNTMVLLKDNCGVVIGIFVFPKDDSLLSQILWYCCVKYQPNKVKLGSEVDSRQWK
ncbi:hypothetical protein VNO80_13505 [Phaseolus coccineus]|uniref:Uncharacterized protein n=1 Tax=Phaseolus coccineus TaxID=3886 RepID=A0AAN9N7L5_PHACN